MNSVKRLFRMPGVHQNLPGALIGTGVGIGLTVASTLLTGLFRRIGKRKNRDKSPKQDAADNSGASTPKVSKNKNMAFGSPAFGSPATSYDSEVIVWHRMGFCHGRARREESH
jgi:hypothetical protein